MQGTISPGLQKLMQSVEELKQLSSPQTPSGAPTLAAQVEQAATQAAAQSAPPAQMPGMLPSDPYRAQLMRTLQAKAQEQAQRMAMLAQGQQQGMASGGIASLPADVEMAEGGVVGYAGPDGSEVELPVNERFKKAFRGLYERIETDLMRQAGATPEQIAQKLGKEPPVVPVSRPMSEAETARLQEANASPAGMPVAVPAPRPPSGQRKETPEARKKPAAETAKPADTGIAALVGPPVPSGSERQFGEALSVAGRVDPGKARTPEQIRAEIEAVYRARGIEPGKAERERLAKLEAFDAQEEAERKKRVDQRGMQDLITFLTGFGGASSMVAGGRRGSEASAQLQQGWERSDEAYNLLKRQRMDAIAAERVALANRNQALADGDIATAGKEAEALRAAQNAKLTAEAQIRANFAPQLLKAETDEKQMRSAETIAELNHKAQRELEEYRRRTQMMKPRELEEIHRVEGLKLNELTGGKPGTATTQQKLEAIQFAHESVKGAPRAESVHTKNRAEAYKRYAEWEKGPGEMLRMTNIKNPKVFEDAAKAKKREIYESLGLEIPGMGGGSSGQEPPPNIKAILNKYGS